MIKVACLNEPDMLSLEVGTDGPSLPLLTLWIQAGTRRTFVIMDEKQVGAIISALTLSRNAMKDYV